MQNLNKKLKKLILPAWLLVASLFTLSSEITIQKLQAAHIKEASTCRGYANWDLEDSSNEVSCLIANKRDLIRPNTGGTSSIQNSKALPFLEQGLLKTLSFLPKSSLIRSCEGLHPITFIYQNNQNAERKALLLAIAQLTSLYDGMSFNTRSYFEGYFFNYPEQDIQFWIENRIYQKNKVQLGSLSQVARSKWSDKEKERYGHLNKKFNIEKTVKESRSETLKWISQYNNYTNQDLLKEFNKLKRNNDDLILNKCKPLSLENLVTRLQRDQLYKQGEKQLTDLGIYEVDKWVNLHPRIDQLDTQIKAVNAKLNANDSNAHLYQVILGRTNTAIQHLKWGPTFQQVETTIETATGVPIEAKPKQQTISFPQLLLNIELSHYDTSKNAVSPEGANAMRAWTATQSTQNIETYKRVVQKMLDGTLKVSLTPQRTIILETFLLLN